MSYRNSPKYRLNLIAVAAQRRGLSWRVATLRDGRAPSVTVRRRRSEVAR